MPSPSSGADVFLRAPHGSPMALPTAGPIGPLTLTQNGTYTILVDPLGASHRQRLAHSQDPATGTFAPWIAALTPRARHTATGLTDGRVLLVGGTDSAGEVLNSAEVWDPRGGVVPVAPLAIARANHRATLLEDGRVLIWGASTRRVHRSTPSRATS